MAFGKIKNTKYDVLADYHTVIGVHIDLSVVPVPTLDDDNSIIGYSGGSKSTVTLASYKDKNAYLAKALPLDQLIYTFDFMTTTAVVNSTEKTCKQAVYDLLKIADPFWVDAETV